MVKPVADSVISVLHFRRISGDPFAQRIGQPDRVLRNGSQVHTGAIYESDTPPIQILQIVALVSDTGNSDDLQLRAGFQLLCCGMHVSGDECLCFPQLREVRPDLPIIADKQLRLLLQCLHSLTEQRIRQHYFMHIDTSKAYGYRLRRLSTFHGHKGIADQRIPRALSSASVRLISSTASSLR